MASPGASGASPPGPRRGLALRLCITLLMLAAMPVMLNLVPSATLPLSFAREADGSLHVRALPEVPLPAPLAEGDVFDLPAMTAEARAALFVASSLPEGLRVDLVVRRDGQRLELPVVAAPDRTRRGEIGGLTGVPITLVFVALLLVTLWRGRDWSAWGLSVFALGVILQTLLQNLPIAPLASAAATGLGIVVVYLLTMPGLFIAADALCGSGLSPRWRRGLQRALVVLALIDIALPAIRLQQLVIEGRTVLNIPGLWRQIPSILLAALPVIALVLGYRGSDAGHRLRIRWVLWSVSLLFVVIVFQTLPVYATLGIPALVASSALVTFSVAGLLYAVLRHRLVDVSFVVDRTLVYGLTTGFVVGVFALLEQLIEKLAVGNDASLLLQAGTTLVVALVLNRVHRRVEATVDRLLFQRQHRSVEQLRAFARECLHVEQPERLLPLAVARVSAALGSPAVRIYARQPAGYARVAAADGPAGGPAIDLDDPLFLALRSQRQPLQLAALSGSALGLEGWAFPMRLRDALIGVLLAIPAPGLQFAPDEREALALLAEELALAQAMLRAREHERFIARIATEAVETPSLQAQARQLLQEPAART